MMIDADVFTEEQQEARRLESLAFTRDIIEKNYAGVVVKKYVVEVDDFRWIYGDIRLRPAFLDENGNRHKGDPYEGMQEFPASELLNYLKTWYWPRVREEEARKGGRRMTIDERRKKMLIDWIKAARETAEKNASGLVVTRYDVDNDEFCWVYGNIQLPKVTDDNGNVRKDDPMHGKAEFPVTELLQYCEAWYRPRRQEMKARKEAAE